MNKPLLITGVPRSGTSIIAGVTAFCGAFTGEINKMYENTDIRGLCKSILYKTGSDVNGHYPLPDSISSRKVNMENIIKKQGYIDGIWQYKDNRITILWEVFNSLYPNAKWVVVRRNDDDIINSCMKTSYMDTFKKDNSIKTKLNVFSEKECWEWVINEYVRRFTIMKKAGLDVFFIYPEQIKETDYSNIKELIEWSGLEYKEKEVIEFINTKIR